MIHGPGRVPVVRERVDRQESADWVASADGRKFMSLASERWCDAGVAAGTDPGRCLCGGGAGPAAYTATGS